MRELRENVEAEKAGSARKLHRVPKTAEAGKRSRRFKFSRNSHKNAPPPDLRGSEEAWKLVTENRPLVGLCARRRGLYARKPPMLDIDDLNSMVMMSFYKDAKRWDPERAKVSTYFSAGLRRCIREIDRFRGQAYMSPALRREAHEIFNTMARERCSVAEAIERMGLSESAAAARTRMMACIMAEKSPSNGESLFYSLSAEQFESREGDKPHIDVPALDSGISTGPGQEAQLIRKETEDIVKKALSTLGPRHRAVLEMRFGFMGREPQNLREIGEEFGLSRERIRQLQNVALRLLRKGKCAEDLKGLTE